MHKNLTNRKKSGITYKVTKKLQKLQTRNFANKGDFIINKLAVKITSVALSAVFILGTAATIYANDKNDETVNKQIILQKPEEYSIIHTISPISEPNFTIRVTDVSERSATLYWQGNEEFTSYTLLYYNETSQKYENCAITNTNSVTLTNLAPNTEHKIILTSNFSTKVLSSISFTTNEQTPVLKASDISSNAVYLDVSNYPSDSKIKIYKSENGNEFKEIDAECKNGVYTDTNVESGKKYYYKAMIYTPYDTILQTKTIEAVTLVSMGLPSVSGSTKTYAHYNAVTAKNSPQYKLLNSKECYTDSETGIRMIDGYYCVALGSYYGSEIGTKYRITFSTGKSINVILCDQKSDRHTDSNHQYAVKNEDIMEFYVQKNKIPGNVRGNYGNLEQFSGSIVSIEKYV